MEAKNVTVKPTPAGETPGKAGTSSPGNAKPDTRKPIVDGTKPAAKQPAEAYVQPTDGSLGTSEGNDKVDKAAVAPAKEPRTDDHGGWINGEPATRAEVDKSTEPATAKK